MKKAARRAAVQNMFSIRHMDIRMPPPALGRRIAAGVRPQIDAAV